MRPRTGEMSRRAEEQTTDAKKLRRRVAFNKQRLRGALGAIRTPPLNRFVIARPSKFKPEPDLHLSVFMTGQLTHLIARPLLRQSKASLGVRFHQSSLSDHHQPPLSLSLSLSLTMDTPSTSFSSFSSSLTTSSPLTPPSASPVFSGFDLNASCPLRLYFTDTHLHYYQSHPKTGLFPVLPSTTLRSFPWSRMALLSTFSSTSPGDTGSVLAFHLHFPDPTSFKGTGITVWYICLSSSSAFLSALLKENIIRLDTPRSNQGDMGLVFTPTLATSVAIDMQPSRGPPNYGSFDATFANESLLSVSDKDSEAKPSKWIMACDCLTNGIYFFLCLVQMAAFVIVIWIITQCFPD